MMVIWFLYEIINQIFLPRQYSIIILTPVLIFYYSIIIIIFYCLLLHGIKEGRSGSVKAFLIFHYTIFGLAIACIFISSNVFAVGYQMFTIPCGLLLMNVLTFLFVFDIGFCVALHSIYLNREDRTKNEKECGKQRQASKYQSF